MHLAESLEPDWEVRVFDRPKNSHRSVGIFCPGVIGSGPELDAAMAGCEAFVYLIHETGSSPYLDSDRQSLTRNMDLLLSTLESAERNGVKKVAFFSSGGAVYGVPQTLPVEEDHPLRPISAYGVAKASMEMYLHAAAHTRGIRYLVIRPSNPYGPGQYPFRKQGVISIFASKILNGETLEMWGNGKARKDYIYVGDMASIAASLLSGDWDNKAYNIGSGYGTSLLDIVAELERVTGKSAAINFHQPKSTDVSEIILDPSRTNERVGPFPSTSLEAGIEATVRWLSLES